MNTTRIDRVEAATAACMARCNAPGIVAAVTGTQAAANDALLSATPQRAFGASRMQAMEQQFADSPALQGATQCMDGTGHGLLRMLHFLTHSKSPTNDDTYAFAA